MLGVALLLALTASINISEIPLSPIDPYFSFTSFGDPAWATNWTVTTLPNYTGKWAVEETVFPQSTPHEKMIFMKTSMAHYGLSQEFRIPLDVRDKPLIVQYELREQSQIDCGGTYIKLFPRHNFSPSTLSNETRYLILFGPDRCGASSHVHFIFNHKNPRTGVYEQKHVKHAPIPRRDKLNHLYTLIIRPDNSFEMMVDTETVRAGSLLSDFLPPVNPPKEMDDPSDLRPSDWDAEEKIPDPAAIKPDDWDESQPEYIKDPEKVQPPAGWLLNEPLLVPDPGAKKPADWDEAAFGAWEPPMIPNDLCFTAPGCGPYEAPVIRNPAFRGKWSAPMVANPKFSGNWRPRQIVNPDYFEDLHPHNFEPIAGVGFEAWMVNNGVGFNNIYIGTDERGAHGWNKDHFIPKQRIQIEQRRKEPTVRPRISRRPAKGFKGWFHNAGRYVGDEWLSFYDHHPAPAILLTILVFTVPCLTVFWICIRPDIYLDKKVEPANPVREGPRPGPDGARRPLRPGDAPVRREQLFARMQ
jgi:calnexin